MKTDVKYRTFDELLDSVRIDFSMYDLEGMIEPQQLIKVAMRINHHLGLKIHVAKEVILRVEKGIVKLPNDLDVINIGVLCRGQKKSQHVPPACPVPSDELPDQCPPSEDLTDPCSDGELGCSAAVLQHNLNKGYIRQFAFRIPDDYERFSHIEFVKDKGIDPIAFRERVRSEYQAYIQKGFLITNFEDGDILLSYQSVMEDAEGNLLVMDHPRVNEYYEYAIKHRILENLLFSGEDVARQYELVSYRLKESKNEALGYVNMIGYNELKNIWELNRKAQYHKYYNMFSSLPGK